MAQQLICISINYIYIYVLVYSLVYGPELHAVLVVAGG